MHSNFRLFGTSCLALVVAALPASDSVGSDSLNCWSSLNAYEAASLSWSKVLVTKILTSSAYAAELETNVPYTTLCDGRPRAVETRYTVPYTTYDPPLTIIRPQGDWDDEKQQMGTFTESAPSCTIDETACTAFQSLWTSAISDWRTNNAPSPTASPQCTTYRPCNENPDSCWIYGRGDKLYYWPVTTTMGDFCAYNGSTIFASPTNPPHPNTVVMDGHTFTSPTNYISFENIRASIPGTTRRQQLGCGTRTYANVFLPVTETLSSFASFDAQTGYPESFNFENLNTIPVSAYEAQHKCINDRDCTTIEGQYTPRMQLPTEILNLEPKEWKEAGCRGIDWKETYQMTPVPLFTPAPRVQRDN